MDEAPIIYVVDDDESVRKATARLFRTAGFDVTTFESSIEFLATPRADRPGCVVLDYQMPGRNGIEVQERLLQQGDSLPIIFITAHGDIPTSVTAMKKGAVDFLPKPVEQETLIETVRTAVDNHLRDRERNRDVDQFKEKLSTLTARERDVLELVVEGLLNKQIASRLGVTEATVKVHRGRMMEKTGVESVAQLVRLCERSDI